MEKIQPCPGIIVGKLNKCYSLSRDFNVKNKRENGRILMFFAMHSCLRPTTLVKVDEPILMQDAKMCLVEFKSRCVTPPNQARSINTYWAYRERKSRWRLDIQLWIGSSERWSRTVDIVISWNYLHATVTIQYRDETRTNVIETQIIIHSFII